MSNDLLFSVLPRQGKEPIAHDDHTVKQVEKEAKLRKLNDEEKQLNAEEREAREKFQKRKKRQEQQSQQQKQHSAKQTKSQGKKQATLADEDSVITQDEFGNKHLDIYI